MKKLFLILVLILGFSSASAVEFNKTNKVLWIIPKNMKDLKTGEKIKLSNDIPHIITAHFDSYKVSKDGITSGATFKADYKHFLILIVVIQKYDKISYISVSILNKYIPSIIYYSKTPTTSKKMRII